ncbi:hypothetical protein AAG570_002846 [Ranatra chinensis]|uniref:Integrase zinc-binding domain-containing protein n=1 Tax=Ranatra chinensis TaxID=642074 RepID=A0ABD0Y533_9HEMI
MFHKNRTQETTENGRCNLPPFCDSSFSTFGNGGWSREQLEQKLGPMCTSMWKYMPQAMGALMKSLGQEDCPIKPGFYVIKDFQQHSNINWPLLPYGRYRFSIKLYQNGKLIGCKRVFVDCVPKKDRRPGIEYIRNDCVKRVWPAENSWRSQGTALGPGAPGLIRPRLLVLVPYVTLVRCTKQVDTTENEDRRLLIIRKYRGGHTNHTVIKETLAQLKRAYWKAIQRTIRQMIEGCRICDGNKYERRPDRSEAMALGPSDISGAVWKPAMKVALAATLVLGTLSRFVPHLMAQYSKQFAGSTSITRDWYILDLNFHARLKVTYSGYQGAEKKNAVSVAAAVEVKRATEMLQDVALVAAKSAANTVVVETLLMGHRVSARGVAANDDQVGAVKELLKDPKQFKLTCYVVLDKLEVQLNVAASTFGNGGWTNFYIEQKLGPLCKALWKYMPCNMKRMMDALGQKDCPLKAPVVTISWRTTAGAQMYAALLYHINNPLSRIVVMQ